MSLSALAAATVLELVPYILKKGGEKLIEKAAEEGFEQRGKIWELVKSLFVEDELTLLNLFEENPEDAKTQGKLEGKIEDRLKENPQVAKQLEELLKQIPQTQNKQNTITQSGNNNIANQDISNSTITFNK